MSGNNQVHLEHLRAASEESGCTVADVKCNLRRTLPAHFRRSSVIIGGLPVLRERENILFHAERPIPSR